MRDFRDAKGMAHTLREALAAKDYKITVGESLELVAKLFGVGDWNTLSSLIKASGEGSTQPGVRREGRGPSFSPSTEVALREALRAAHERFQSESTAEHLLLALTRDVDAGAIMNDQGVDPRAVSDLLLRSAELSTTGDRNNAFADPTPSLSFQRIVQRAILDAQAAGEWNITGAHLLEAVVSESDGTAARVLREQGFNRGAN